MNSMDELNEKIGENAENNSDEKDAIDNSDELEKAKRTNEFTAKDNAAQYQIFVQNLDSLFAGYRQNPKGTKIKQDTKKYDLSSLEACSEFVEKYGDSEYVAVAIILCTFEVVPVGDLPNLEERLM